MRWSQPAETRQKSCKGALSTIINTSPGITPPMPAEPITTRPCKKSWNTRDRKKSQFREAWRTQRSTKIRSRRKSESRSREDDRLKSRARGSTSSKRTFKLQALITDSADLTPMCNQEAATKAKTRTRLDSLPRPNRAMTIKTEWISLILETTRPEISISTISEMPLPRSTNNLNSRLNNKKIIFHLMIYLEDLGTTIQTRTSNSSQTLPKYLPPTRSASARALRSLLRKMCSRRSSKTRWEAWNSTKRTPSQLSRPLNSNSKRNLKSSNKTRTPNNSSQIAPSNRLSSQSQSSCQIWAVSLEWTNSNNKCSNSSN